jgi:hypothetical protein
MLSPIRSEIAFLIMPKKLLDHETPQCGTLEETRITTWASNVENAPTLNIRHHSEETSTNNVEIGQFKQVSHSELSNILIHG